MESKPKFTGNKDGASHYNGALTSRDITLGVKILKKQKSVDRITPDIDSKIEKTGKVLTKTSTAAKEELKDIKASKGVIGTKERSVSKSPVKGGLLVKGMLNESNLKGKEKGKNKLTALMRLKGSVHTIQALNKLSRYSNIFSHLFVFPPIIF